MINESGILFPQLEPEAVDLPFGTRSGAGVIFGVTGGVTEAVIRRVASDKSLASLDAIAFSGVRGMDGVKEARVPYGDRVLKIAVVSGLGNAEKLIQKIKSGVHYDLVEVMACPGGCVAGAGQPVSDRQNKADRGKALYAADKLSNIKRAEENPLMLTLYQGLLKGRVHELLHVEYKAKKED